jgi:hypothetical protein
MQKEQKSSSQKTPYNKKTVAKEMTPKKRIVKFRLDSMPVDAEPHCTIAPNNSENKSHKRTSGLKPTSHSHSKKYSLKFLAIRYSH